jgi:hypothetical protein
MTVAEMAQAYLPALLRAQAWARTQLPGERGPR